MPSTLHASFDSFAQSFVRAYWETVKHGDFAMPPNEAVEETVEELLAVISHSTEIQLVPGPSDILFKLRMTSEYEDCWLFAFRDTSAGWTLVSCLTQPGSVTQNNLLEAPYSQWFKPFLEHVTRRANASNRSK